MSDDHNEERCPSCRRRRLGAPRLRLDTEAMARQYAAGVSIRQLAERHSVSFGTARTRLLSAGVELRRRGDSYPHRKAAA